jgi:hypothetical protein
MAVFVLVHGARGGSCGFRKVAAQNGPPGSGLGSADRVRQPPAWRYQEITTNHMIPGSRPEELAAVLLELTA